MIKSLSTRLHKLRSNLNLIRIIRLVWSVSRKWTVISFVFILIETAFFFSSLYVLKLLIDLVAHQPAGGQDHSKIVLYILYAGIIGILYFLTRAVSTYMTEVQAAHVSEYINDRIHQHTVALDLSFYEDASYFDVLKRAMEAGTHRPSQVIISLFDILKNIMTILALGSVLLTIDWMLLPLLVIFVIPTLLIRIHFSDVFNQWRIDKTPLERKSDYLSSLITSEQSAKEVRSFNLGPQIKKDYLNIRIKLLAERLQISRKRTNNEIISSAMAAIGFFFCIGYIILSKDNAGHSVGDITVFLVVFPQTFNVLQNLAGGISTLYQNNIFINCVFELFDLTPMLADPPHPLPVVRGVPFSLELRHVSFSYPHVRDKNLHDINMRLEAGKIVAVVGANGAGKSSLIKLICRLYDPDEGSILLRGTDIRKFAGTVYREQIGVVFQDYMRFQVSARENIAYGGINLPFSEERMKEAAFYSGADEFIEAMPHGYETVLGKLFDHGREPSLGQWQKIAIARCLYSQAQLLIFDEASSSLDAASEQAVFRSLRNGSRDRAALVVSHRYSVTKYADYIYVLSRGNIVEAGTHEVLIGTDGAYARLFRDQINAETELT